MKVSNPDLVFEAPAFAVAGNQLAWAEVLGFASGLWCVWLTSQHIWNFPVGIANCALLLMLFFDARLLADGWHFAPAPWRRFVLAQRVVACSIAISTFRQSNRSIFQFGLSFSALIWI